MRIALIVLAVALQLAISMGVPYGRDRRQLAGTRKVEEESAMTCQNFTVTECNNLGDGYNTALFPNRQQGWDLDMSRTQFGYFSQLVKSGCSAKVSTLFCFYFFPFCELTSWNALPMSERKPVMPCRETCQDVRNSCETLLESHVDMNGHNFSWPDFLDCDNEYFLPASTMRCANGTSSLSTKDTKEIDPPNEAATTEVPTIKGVTEDDSGATTVEILGGKPQSETLASVTPTPACNCPKCNPRTKVTGKTFKNNNYTFGEFVLMIIIIIIGSLACACARRLTEINCTVVL